MNFNPRSHERSDDWKAVEDTLILKISIHAPTRGATDDIEATEFGKEFQSTLPREERLLLKAGEKHDG